MAFGLNRAEVIGRLGADVTISQLASGGRVANMSIGMSRTSIASPASVSIAPSGIARSASRAG